MRRRRQRQGKPSLTAKVIAKRLELLGLVDIGYRRYNLGKKEDTYVYISTNDRQYSSAIALLEDTSKALVCSSTNERRYKGKDGISIQVSLVKRIPTDTVNLAILLAKDKDRWYTVSGHYRGEHSHIFKQVHREVETCQN